MAIKTKIQWCDSTVNPTLGCSGCELWNPRTGVKDCYAGVFTGRFGRSNPGLADDFNHVSSAPARMADAATWSDLAGCPRPDKPWLDGLPRLIFVGDMADTLSDGIDFPYLRDEVIAAVASDLGQRHQWLWLTKRPKRMAEFSAWLAASNVHWPANLWSGTSVTTQATTSRIEALMAVGDAETIRFVSVEPQWEAIDITAYLPWLNWVIQGGHSGSHDHPFALEWADDLRTRCREHNVPYFLKQLGSAVTLRGAKARFGRGQRGDWHEWPARLRVRQMPLTHGRRRRTIKQRKVMA